MRAAICTAFGLPLSVERVTLDAPGPDELRIAIRACAICHSDLSLIDGLWGGDLPAVYGHEAAGVVLETGPDPDGFSVGDRVVVTLIRSCGTCRCCERGLRVCCTGSFARDGGAPVLRRSDGAPLFQGLRTAAFAEEALVHVSQAVRIDADTPFDVASLLACGVITGTGAVFNTARVQPGESVAVIGLGGVGMNVVQGARLAGADPIIGIDIAPEKLTAALRFGATHTLIAGSDGLAEQLRAISGSSGVDHVFVCAGVKAAVDGAPPLLAPGGAVTIVGMPASGVMAEYEPVNLAHYGQRILGSKMGNSTISEDIPRLIGLYRDGRLELDALIGERFPLERINDAIAASRSGTALRNVIMMG